jgi:hypothetical protein
MATLAFAVGGAAIGGAIGGGVTFLGATVTSAAIGQAIGAIAGSYVDSLLFGTAGQPTVTDSPRLSDLSVVASTEGATIPKIYGRYRVGGQIIWATNFEEEVSTSSVGGGKGLNVGRSQTQTKYRYYANFAIGLCEGEITRIGRVWADGDELTISDYDYRVYNGTETQTVDSLIESIEGSGNAPAYRGLAYIVFERFPLEDFGNRLPQFNFEVFRAVDTFEGDVLGITMIPAAGEFAYEPLEIRTDGGGGTTYSENRHVTAAVTDWAASLDQLEEVLPNCGAISLFSAWFGDDLRCGNCTIVPKVDTDDKDTTPKSWAVAGLTRSTAQVVSTDDSRPAYGGTPNDSSIIDAIVDMNDRGFDVLFTPFLLMDIPDGNGLTDPYDSLATDQPSYPWRGRITCSPAPGEAGSPDQTATAGTQVDTFYGTVDHDDFSVNTTTKVVTYSGPSEWTYSRFILHNAALCAAAGGVSAFVIGSEMRGLTWVRESASSYPFVDNLITLANEVKQIFVDAGVSEPDVTYAADWSEYFGHQPTDGSNDVYFHLDDLWSDSNIDAVAIDNYWPLADWRDGTSHLDYVAGTRSIYDSAYLKGNIEGGEGYDYFYASDADRDSQTRTTITDGAYSKPWVFRFKDIKSWWENEHYNRPGGTESVSATSWVPESKPIWFTELGCPAVDKGSNQPNVFFDPKSAESFYPYYSRGTRDDLIQRVHLKAFLEYYNPADDEFVADNNPVSSVYADRMVDIDRIMIYTWDARPYPAFPLLRVIWSDGDNWQRGHWITGRVSDAPLQSTVESILGDYGFTNFSATDLNGIMAGYLVDKVGSAREALQPLELLFFFDSYESQGSIRFTQRGSGDSLETFTPDDLAEVNEGQHKYEIVRAQETDLATSVKLNYSDSGSEYEQATAEARKLIGGSLQVAQGSFTVAMTYTDMVERANIWLHEIWTTRERFSMALPPSKLAYEPTDILTLSARGRLFPFRVISTGIAEALMIEGKANVKHVYDRFNGGEFNGEIQQPVVYGSTTLALMDIPLITGLETPHAGRIAAFQSPWPGFVNVYRAPNTTDYVLNTQIPTNGALGETVTAFAEGVTDVWDDANTLRVQMYGTTTLSSASEDAVLNGANLMAVESTDGEWELFQFTTATLIGSGVYDLSGLLRGQFGTEGTMRDNSPVAIGARVVLINTAVAEAGMTLSEIKIEYNWKYGPGPYAISDPTYTTEAHTFQGIGLRPYSPAHIEAEFDGSNNLDITWIRRTRIGGDNWEVNEVPLNEESEAYEVDVMDGGNVVRTLSSTSETVQYTSAQQTTDWGSVQASYVVRVYQISSSFGRGEYREATVP